MRKITIHMIGQAHLDPVWLWNWTEGKAEALATSQSAIDRLQEYPSFIYTRGEAQVYEWIEEEDPHLFSQIKDEIQQGRWHAVNGMIIQPDMNLPSGEAFVRQFLLGKRYMREHLGIDPQVAYCVDSFGHAATLPQIMQKCGFKAYTFTRPQPHEKALPDDIFWWQAPDGSKVLCFRISEGYNSTGITDHRSRIERAIEIASPYTDHTMCFFGVGNHGGGPTKVQIEDILSIAKERNDVDIIFSSPQQFFDAVQPDSDRFPTIIDELQMHAVGCYSAQSSLKRLNRKAENSLLLAERMSVLAQILTGYHPHVTDLRDLWHTLCFLQFHDILAGSSIKEASDEAEQSYGHILHSAGEVINQAGRSIATRIDTSGKGSALILFNPFPHPLSQPVEYEPWTNWETWEKFGWNLVDNNGTPVPCQVIEERSALSTNDFGFSRIVFHASIPPLGYRVYHFDPSYPQVDIQNTIQISENRLENKHLCIILDPETGEITSCLDKDSGMEMVGKDRWNSALVLEDMSDTWSHQVTHYKKVIGAFKNARIKVMESGPIRASLLVERTYENSTWLQQIILYEGSSKITIHNWLHWQGHWKMVKLAFDSPIQSPQSVHDIPFGWINRPCDGAEAPTQMWMDISGPAISDPTQTIGIGIINDGKYSCDVNDTTGRLSILRCPPYAHNTRSFEEPIDPFFELREKSRHDWIDQGEQEFTIVLVPHTGSWQSAGIIQSARELNMPIYPVTMHCHQGSLSTECKMLELTSQDMELTAMKPAEDGNGLIIRVADRHGQGATGQIVWLNQSFDLQVKPFEVVTLRLQNINGEWKQIPCSMLEE